MERLDNERALEDLQRLNDQILQARAQRRRAEAEFDAFTNSFERRRPQPEPGSVLPPSPPPGNHPAMAPGDVTERPWLELGAPDALPEPDALPDAPHVIAPPAPVSHRDRRVPVLAVTGIAIAIAVGAGMFAVRGREQTPDRVTPDAAATQSAATTANAPQPSPSAATPATPSPVVTPGVNVEITTRRRVWMRVMLDGKRAFEREVPGDQTIPLHANRSIVIRAGDAGAVAITRHGRDAGPLGRDGVVATREFTTDTPGVSR